MAVFPGQSAPKTIVQGTSQPQVVRKETGEIFILVRDDVNANGKLYLAPVGSMTSMFSVKPEQFRAEYEWYVPAKERPLPEREVQTTFQNVTPVTQQTVDANLPQVDAGGPIGPFIPFASPEAEALAQTMPPEGEQFLESSTEVTAPKKPRGRPKGSKNKKKRKT